MRFIHTSDWHLGHRLYGLNRGEEQRAVLNWLVEQVSTHDVDALIIAGDIFDTHNPSAEATRLYYRFLHQVHQAAPHVQVVVIGGNHDSAQRLDAPRDVLRALNVSVIGGMPQFNTPAWEDLYVPLTNKSGETEAWVAAVPFLRSSDLPIMTEDSDDRIINGVREVYQHTLSHLKDRVLAHQGVILTGHCQMSKSILSKDSERQVPGYGDTALPSDVFSPEGSSIVSYVALGHLHLAQTVSGCDWIRYSGSPLAFSISESLYPHQVLLVELDGPDLKEVTPLLVPETIKVEMIRIPDPAPSQQQQATELDTPVTKEHARALSLREALRAIDRLETADPSQPAWQKPVLQVNIHCEAPDPTIKSKVLAALEGKNARLAKISVSYPGRHWTPSSEAPTRHLRDIDPDDIFRARWRERRGDDPPQDLMDIFQRLRDEARGSLNVDHESKETSGYQTRENR